MCFTTKKTEVIVVFLFGGLLDYILTSIQLNLFSKQEYKGLEK